LIVSEPSAFRRRLAADYGATVIDPASVDLIEAVEELTSGERSPIADRSDGVAQLFKQIPRLVRKQATMLALRARPSRRRSGRSQQHSNSSN